MYLLVERVTIGSLEHLLPIFLALVLAFFFIRYANKSLRLKQKQFVIHAFAIVVSLTIVAFHIYHIYQGHYNFKTDLPLFLCSFMALIIPIFTYFRAYWMYEILIFWIIAGTSQGVITPDIPEGYPSFDYFRYWIVHLGLLIIIFYATFVFGMRPKFQSIFKSIIALMIYITIMIVLNFILDANYSYLNYKPESASVLDALGEWPWYLLQALLLIFPYFMLIYLPFYLAAKQKKKTI